MTNTSPRWRGSNDTEAASPPLIFPRPRRAGYGPPLRPQGSLPRSLRDGLRPPLGPEDLCGPWQATTRAGQGLPRLARGATSTITKDPRSHYPESLRLQGVAGILIAICGPVSHSYSRIPV